MIFELKMQACDEYRKIFQPLLSGFSFLAFSFLTYNEENFIGRDFECFYQKISSYLELKCCIILSFGRQD